MDFNSEPYGFSPDDDYSMLLHQAVLVYQSAYKLPKDELCQQSHKKLCDFYIQTYRKCFEARADEDEDLIKQQAMHAITNAYQGNYDPQLFYKKFAEKIANRVCLNNHLLDTCSTDKWDIDITAESPEDSPPDSPADAKLTVSVSSHSSFRDPWPHGSSGKHDAIESGNQSRFSRQQSQDCEDQPSSSDAKSASRGPFAQFFVASSRRNSRTNSFSGAQTPVSLQSPLSNK